MTTSSRPTAPLPRPPAQPSRHGAQNSGQKKGNLPNAKPITEGNIRATQSRAPAKKSESDGNGGVARGIRTNLLLLSVLLAIAISDAVLIWYVLTGKVEVIATTEAGAIIKPVPLQQAFVTEPRVLGFVDECLRDSFSHDFENYRRTMNSALACYTSAGGKEFTKAIESTLLDIRNKRVVLTVTTEPPTLQRGPLLIQGRATWEVSAVITLYYQGTRERYPAQQRRATVTVVRVPLEENLRGISINAIQLAPYIKQ